MSSGRPLSPDLGGTKHEFAMTYDRPLPTRYLKEHLALDYVIPQNARSVFDTLITACMRERRRDRLKIVDVGCSYGINGALLKSDMTLDELYTAAALRRGPLAQRYVDVHRRFFAERLSRKDLFIVGVDPAVRAVRYAEKNRLIDAAVTTDLERQDLSESDIEHLSGADMIISTGCVGYVTDRTFRRLYAAVASSKPWVACFVMHPFSYSQIAEALALHGLQTHDLKNIHQRQRRFSTVREKRSILAAMKQADMDDRLERTTGYVYASFHLSVPEDAAAASLSALCPQRSRQP